jgi:glc operon protein GlcG
MSRIFVTPRGHAAQRRAARRLLLLAVAMGVLSNGAQAADVAVRAALTLDGAKALVAEAVAKAAAVHAPGAAIAVVDPAGTLIYLERSDATFANASAVAAGKARTAALFRKPTREFEDAVNKGRHTLLAVAEVAPFTPLTGGVPVEVDGQLVGAIGISGAASAAQDDEIATAAVVAFARRSAQP